jgi:protein ImuA
LGQRALACAGRRETATFFWIAGPDARNEAGLIYGPGLEALGLGGIELVRVFARGAADALWAAGEVAAHKGAGLCLLELRGNPARADLAFSRRLALRAREAGVPVIVLRQGGGEEASAALTRWRVAPAPSDPGPRAGRKWLGPPAFAVTLEKCRGGHPGEWLMEWKSDERLFAPVRSAAGAGTQPAGFPPGAAGAPLSLDRPHPAFDRPAGAAAARPGLAARRAS